MIYSTDVALQYRYRKVKSVITALAADVVDTRKETFYDLREISPIPTLPLLKTPKGNFTSSNTIIRYLAASNNNKLYGGDNLYHRGLIDQWLDVTVCEFDTCLLATLVYCDGKEV